VIEMESEFQLSYLKELDIAELQELWELTEWIEREKEAINKGSAQLAYGF
jgi:hypothetical protein